MVSNVLKRSLLVLLVAGLLVHDGRATYMEPEAYTLSCVSAFFGLISLFLLKNDPNGELKNASMPGALVADLRWTTAFAAVFGVWATVNHIEVLHRKNQNESKTMGYVAILFALAPIPGMIFYALSRNVVKK